MQLQNTTSVLFSENLRNAMTERGLTQLALAEKIGVTQTAVSKWLNASIPRGDQLLSLASFLGVSMEWLLTSEGTNPKASHALSPRPISAAAKKALRTAQASLDTLKSELEGGG